MRRTFSGASTCPGCTSPPPGCTEDFQSCLYLLMQRGLSICSCLHSLKGEEEFFYSRLLSLNGEEVFFCSCLHSLKGEKDFFLPALAQSRGGLFLACTRSKSRRTFSCLHLLKVEEDFLLPALAQVEEDFFSFSPALARGRGGLFLFCLRTHESVEVFNYHWCLRSPKDDEDFKTLTTAADRRKTMGTLKLLTGAANRRKTMGTLKLLTESMRYNFELALNHARVIRSFFDSKNFQHKRHANS